MLLLMAAIFAASDGDSAAFDAQSVLFDAGGPNVNPGKTETNSGLFGCSLANFHAAFSANTFDRGYDACSFSFQSFSS